MSDTVVSAPPAASLPGLAELRRIAIVPALNEELALPIVIDELRAFDPGLDIVVVDDGSVDRTAAVAAAKGARVLRLPFNLGIGGAVQTGFRYAYEHGYDLAVRVDGDGQHDPQQLSLVIAPVLRGEADIAVGSRFASTGAGYRSSRTRRVGIRLLAWIVSRIVGQRVTDTTSGFQALNREGIALFARDYPHDYPEVEATVMVFRHRLRLCEVPVTMRERGGGRSSITALRSIYYMVKVLLAIFVGLFRRNVVPQEDSQMTPLAVSIAGAIASFTLVLVVLELIRSHRLRERYALLWLAHRPHAHRAVGVARRAEHDRRLGRRARLSARRALCRRHPLHPRRAAPLLDGDLAPLRPEHPARAAARAARAAGRAAALRPNGDVERRADDVDVARGRVVDPARDRCDPVVEPHTRDRVIDERRLSASRSSARR